MPSANRELSRIRPSSTFRPFFEEFFDSAAQAPRQSVRSHLPRLINAICASMGAAIASRKASRNNNQSLRTMPWLTRFGAAPLVLGLASLPCLMLKPSFFRRGLGPATGIEGQSPLSPLPDQPDWSLSIKFFFLPGFRVHSPETIAISSTATTHLAPVSPLLPAVERHCPDAPAGVFFGSPVAVPLLQDSLKTLLRNGLRQFARIGALFPSHLPLCCIVRRWMAEAPYNAANHWQAGNAFPDPGRQRYSRAIVLPRTRSAA